MVLGGDGNWGKGALPGTEAQRYRGTDAQRPRGTEAQRHRGTEAHTGRVNIK